MKTIRMKKADWQKWDAALRSGDYTQGPEWLRNPETGSYCCLGVLQHCLAGRTENDPVSEQELPSEAWLEEHGIVFSGFKDGLPLQQQPYLKSLRGTAADVNDETTVCEETGAVLHTYTFVDIADAIAESVEFTDQ